MSVLAVFGLDRARADTVGLVAKADALVGAARAYGLAVDCVMLVRGVPRLMDNRPTTLVDAGYDKRASQRALLSRLPKFVSGLTPKPYTTLWLRALPLNPIWLQALSAFQRSGCRVVWDVPTYPNDAERSGWQARLLHTVDSWSRRWSSFTPDAVATLSHHDRIWDAPTVRVSNGCPRPDPVAHEAQALLTLVGVGQWAFWHGLDRLWPALEKVKGLVRCVFVGDGPARLQYETETVRLDLDCTWLGSRSGDELRRVLAKADLAVGTLGIHRKDVARDQSLKHRLYASVGLPFVCTDRDDTFDAHRGVLSLASTDEPIDADLLLTFTQTARKRRTDLASDLLQHAAEHSWRHAYAPLFDYFRTPNPR